MIAHIFIDEYGTPELDVSKQGVTPYFVYTGVVIEEKELLNARNTQKQIISKYFQNTYMKSANIKNDSKGHMKRMNILSELSKFNHYVTALLVDKSKINEKSGLEYKRSFIKFFANLFSKQFFYRYKEYHIYLDKMGHIEFQQSLKEYMDKQGYVRNLFSNISFNLKEDEKEEPLLQFADFYAGCIGKYYCGKYEKGQAQAINNEIKSRVFIDWFPREFTNYLGINYSKQDGFSDTISEIAIKTAEDYLEKENDEIGCEIVNILLQETYINPLRLISSGELKRKLNLIGRTIDPIIEIGKLRDKGVFIVSPIGKKGYKFPCNEQEVSEHYNRISTNVIPQLKRGYILHKILVEQSGAAYNILEHKEFSLLSTLINKVVSEQNDPLLSYDDLPRIQPKIKENHNE